MSSRVITISREFGSGGRTVGRLVSEKLGIPCYDQELIEKIAGESGLSREYISERGETVAHSPLFSGTMIYDRSYGGFSVQDMLWQAQRKVIVELADKGPCVIVGRCGDYILRDRPDLVKVFVHAPKEWRAERIRTVYGDRAESPIRRVEEKDRRRRAYYRLYTDLEWGDPHNYHLSMDSAALGIEKCAELICAVY
ncbi:MAG: cytidylate kinase-like family protein [Clostridia bacterium]|nr:cytidylate kinase-like family protein [Clostridia bacterium]